MKGDPYPLGRRGVDDHFESNDCDDLPTELLDDAQEEFIHDPEKFDSMVRDADKSLFSGCEKRQLSTMVKFYDIKAENGVSDKCFSQFLYAIKEILPMEKCFPESTYEVKKTLSSIGLKYEKNHACPNDCILYRKEYAHMDTFSECGLPRRVKDGKLWHPADSQAWKKVNYLNPDFAAEPRHLRLGLSADGVNPHRSLSSRHSSWPMFLVMYNLPPWLVMKRKFTMLSLMISGPKQSGHDIDVNLAPLVDDLKELNEDGVDAYDGFKKEFFKLKVVLLWTVSDFPAYSNLSGLSTKGYEEREVAPLPLSGRKILEEVEKIDFKYGKEKNVCESIVSTLLDIPGKSKDGLSSRLDLVELGIRHNLAPVDKGKRTYLPPAAFTLSKEEKQAVCNSFAKMKVPDGYSSNVRNLVCMEELKLMGMKLHDCRILMQQLLPISIRSVLPKKVRETLTKVCIFFNQLRGKELEMKKLDSLHDDIVQTLCNLEKYFPPSFFDIMIHLMVHLVREAKLCGLVWARWMYPFEINMKVLKGNVRNHNRPKACMVECYISEEAVEFRTEYIAGVDAIRLSKPRNHLNGVDRGLRGKGSMVTVSRLELDQAHLPVLENNPEVQPYIT
ncbi:uncharacterized protein LOC133035962 [Cannabis sativa]|uniref:uncharacterized protein LOC133035962 n=1 Tax=Cannabis sativa TaxID=3483 RepID=UPI0029CA6059|nr:uncharacterized protein LOC133035962 [Cannabis sativa]